MNGFFSAVGYTGLNVNCFSEHLSRINLYIKTSLYML